MSIARRARVPLLPAFVVDEPDSCDPLGVRLVILPPIDLHGTRDAKRDIIAGARVFAAVFEAQIRAQPHLWARWSLAWRKRRYLPLWKPPASN